MEVEAEIMLIFLINRLIDWLIDKLITCLSILIRFGGSLLDVVGYDYFDKMIQLLLQTRTITKFNGQIKLMIFRRKQKQAQKNVYVNSPLALKLLLAIPCR